MMCMVLESNMHDCRFTKMLARHNVGGEVVGVHTSGTDLLAVLCIYPFPIAQGMEQVAANVSCLAAGFTSCCTEPNIEDCRTRGPSGCYCDQSCYTSVGRECCADIGSICGELAPTIMYSDCCVDYISLG